MRPLDGAFPVKRGIRHARELFCFLSLWRLHVYDMIYIEVAEAEHPNSTNIIFASTASISAHLLSPM